MSVIESSKPNVDIPKLKRSLIDSGKKAEIQARQQIENVCGLAVHDANLVLRENCPNVDLIVYAHAGAYYVQVKSTSKAAGRNCLVVDGSPWTTAQLYGEAPIFNKHHRYKAKFVVLVGNTKLGSPEFYVAPPAELESLAKSVALKLAARPKRDGTPRSISFRKEVPKQALQAWRDAWHLMAHQ
jgi:hypothetical protein